MPEYFAYGSNLSTRRLVRRCPSARFVTIGHLPGYRLDFPLTDATWGGGVAGVLPQPDEVVEGVVYHISAPDLQTLDEYEDVDRGDYTRVLLPIVTPSEERIQAWTYLPKQMPGFPFPPTRLYLDTILQGAREHGLSEDYIEKLKKIVTADR